MLKTGGENLDARLLRFRTDPASEDAGRLAEQLLRQSRSSDALEVLAKRLELAPDDVAALVASGRTYLQIGELVQAQQSLMQAAKLRPNDYAPFRLLGEVLLKRGDPGRAVKVLERAKAIGGADAEVDQLLARATRLSRLADGDVGGSPFADELPTAKLAAAPPPAPVPPPRFPPPAPAAPPAPAGGQPVGRGALGTRMGIGQLGPLSQAGPGQGGRPTPPLEEPTVVGSDIRRQVASELARTEPSPTDAQSLFDDESTEIHDVLGAAPADLARPTPAPIPARPKPAPRPPPDLAGFPRASDGLDDIPASVPPPKRQPPRPEAPRVEGLRRAAERPPSGGAPGREDVDAILDMLEEERIFEPPVGETATWAEPVRGERGGTRVGRVMIVLWVFVLLGAGGAYYGFEQYTERQQAEAQAMRSEATTLAFRGDEKDLTSALSLVDEADRLQPTAVEGSSLRVALLAQRLLEGGGVDRSLLRASVDRAERLGGDEALVQAGRAVAVYAEARPDAALELLGGVVEASSDPWVSYLRGRVLQRLGRDEASDVLSRALEAEPSFVAVELALAEVDLAEERTAEAIERYDGVLAREPEHLRARLWKSYLQADDDAPESILSSLASLEQNLPEAAPSDRALARLLEARAARRSGDPERAANAIEQAVTEPIASPRILFLLAREATAVGALGRAQQAATTALAASPEDVEARVLLAEVQLERGDAREALSSLGALSTENPDVMRLSARAALLLGGPALEAADSAMDTYLESATSPSVEMRALAMRLKSRRGDASQQLSLAERLVRSAPGDPDALAALAEIALDAREPAKALSALSRLEQTAGNRPRTHFLIGRAQRMEGRAAEARAAFERAIELDSGFGDAKVALGYLLLDMGDYEAADRAYQEMASGTRLASGSSTALLARLGRVEALLGLGQLDDAKVQLEAIPSRDAEAPDVRVTTARVALADGRPADALSQLRPLAESDAAGPDIVALFGDALYAAGETAAASEQYERAIGIDAGSPEALVGYAQVLVRGEKHRDAHKILDRAAQALERRIRPPALRARMLLLRGRAYLAEGKRGDATSALRQATGLAGVAPDAWFFLGEALVNSSAQDARAAYSRYLELAPNGQFAERARRANR